MHEPDNRIRMVNRAFNRPFIHINVAASIDGKIALGHGDRLVISTRKDLERVHRLRNRVDGILIGINTAIKDDPSLLVKGEYISQPARNPVRIVVDSTGKMPPANRMLSGEGKTVIAVTEGNEANLSWVNDVDPAAVTVIGVEPEVDGKVNMKTLFGILYYQGIASILVEGGSTVISYLLRKGYYDTFTIFFRNIIVGGMDAPSIAGGTSPLLTEDVLHLNPPVITEMEGGFLLEYTSENEWWVKENGGSLANGELDRTGELPDKDP